MYLLPPSSLPRLLPCFSTRAFLSLPHWALRKSVVRRHILAHNKYGSYCRPPTQKPLISCSPPRGRDSCCLRPPQTCRTLWNRKLWTPLFFPFPYLNFRRQNLRDFSLLIRWTLLLPQTHKSNCSRSFNLDPQPLVFLDASFQIKIGQLVTPQKARSPAFA